MKPAVTRRARIWLRVSKEEQHTENQREPCVQLVRARGWTIDSLVEEKISGVKDRPILRRWLDDAHRGNFEVLVVWKLDRLGRKMHERIAMVLEFAKRGVDVISVTETWTETSDPHVRNLLHSIWAWLAEDERNELIERTHLGLERARRSGIRLGRPKARVDIARARVLLAGGTSQREAARLLGVGDATLRRALASLPKEAEPGGAARATRCAVDRCEGEDGGQARDASASSSPLSG